MATIRWQGQYNVSNGVTVNWLALAQNAMQSLQNQAGQAPSPDRQDSAALDGAEGPSKRTRVENGGSEMIMSSAPSKRGWANIQFQGKKLLVPADSIATWQAYDPSTLIIGPDS